MRKLPDIEKLKLTPGWLLVEEFKDAQEVDGLINPQQYDDKSEFATVIEHHPSANFKAPEIPKGKLVFYNKYAPIRTSYRGKEYSFLREEDIILYG